jgi:hypothetical protein
MKTIRVKGRNVNVSQIYSWDEDYEEREEPILQKPGGELSNVLGHKTIRTIILKIELTGSGGEKVEKVTLRGPEAEAALEILKSSES